MKGGGVIILNINLTNYQLILFNYFLIYYHIIIFPLATINRLTRIEGGDELTKIEGGDDLHACVSAHVPYFSPLVIVAIVLVPNADNLTKNSVPPCAT